MKRSILFIIEENLQLEEKLWIFSLQFINNPSEFYLTLKKYDKLNLFSTQDQLSTSTVSDYYLSLSSEFQFNSDNIECFRSSFRQLKLKDKDDYYKSLSQKIVLPGSEQFFPILNNNFNSFLAYLDGYKYPGLKF